MAVITPAALTETCLALPSTTQEYPFRDDQVCVFKVRGKMFALSVLTAAPLKVSLKCDPDLAVQLRLAHPEVVPGYHLNKRHWNTVDLTGSLPFGLVADLIEDSYELVVAGLPKAERAAIAVRRSIAREGS